MRRFAWGTCSGKVPAATGHAVISGRDLAGHRTPSMSQWVSADSRAAAKIWDDALGDVTEAGRKLGPSGLLQMVARRPPRK